MPSPIAHASVAFLGSVALGDRPEAEPRWRTWTILLLVVFACGAPDMDIIIGWLLINDPFTYQGAYSHSLLLAPIFGLLFASAMKLLRPGFVVTRAFALGTVLYAGHVVMDALIYDTRGVAMLWPLIPDRFASPIIVFVGVEYGRWWQWEMHLLTIANEAAFGILMLWISRQFRRRGQPRGSFAHATG